MHVYRLYIEFYLQDLSETFTTSCANGQFELEESVEAMLEVIKAVNDSLHQINIKVSAGGFWCSHSYNEKNDLNSSYVKLMQDPWHLKVSAILEVKLLKRSNVYKDSIVWY